MAQSEFSFIPVLGRKVDVPQNDPELFKAFGDNIATHDVGGVNFDLARKRHACAKANGYAQWSNTVNAQATKCLGLFELYDGTNRDHIFFDNGRVYVYDSGRNPVAKTNFVVPFDSGSTAPAIGNTLEETGAGADASGVLAAFEVTSGTWGAGTAAGRFYLSSSTGTWSNDLVIGINGGAADIATVNGTATSTTFANDNIDLYSMVSVGNYIAFADRGENTPHKWKNGDTYLTPLIATATSTDSSLYKFRFLVNFARRVVGLYCIEDTNAPELSVRWSSSWPTTTVANLTFALANQLYIPNDDPIVGGATIGSDKCFIYCESSIQQLVSYQDYELPFKCFTVVPSIGCTNHQSIVNLGNRHLFFNRDYGFMSFDGASTPVPISDDIEPDIKNMIADNANMIVGTYAANMRCAVWSVPMESSSTPNKLLFYHIDTGQWWWLDRSFRCLGYWQGYTAYTWQDLIRDLGGLEKARGTADTNTANKLVDSAANFVTAGVAVGDEAHNTTDGTYGVVTVVAATELTFATDPFPDGNEKYEVGSGATWEDAGANSWSYYSSLATYLVGGNTDGHTYTHASESIYGITLSGYRVEPVLDFGDAKRKDLLLEIWFQLAHYGTHSLDVYHRSGDTLGEITGSAWTSVGSIALDTNKPVVYVNQSARLHQIKWGTDSNSEYFEVNKITFKFITQSEN